jgi:hypothetical protein
MADGRLDEAFDIVQSDDIKQHRRGQKLISRLARTFTKRGQENLDSERIQLALADCNKAEKLAGNTADVARLRSAICSEMEQRRFRNRHRSLKVAQARQHIREGWLSAGEQILHGAGDEGGEAAVVLQQAAATRLQISEAIRKAQEMLRRDDLDGAIDIVLKAGIVGSQNDGVVELISKIKLLAVKQIREHLDDGRISLAHSLWERMSPVANGCGEISDLGRMLTHCRQAADHVAAGRPREAVPLLRKVKLTCPSAKWLSPIIDQARQAAELLDELAASPLGLDFAQNQPVDEQYDASGKRVTRPRSNSRARPKAVPCEMQSDTRGDSSLPSRFVLQIDGIGSFVVLREGRVTVGPVSSSARPTVGLMADPNLPVVTIERSEDDYFIRSSSPVRVNDTATTHKLLVNGDRIGLSPRCVMKFSLANPASTTASLGLSSARLGRADVRQVILMDRDLLIGPTTGNHVMAEFLDETFTLFIQNGRLLCKARERILVDDKPVSSTTGLPVNKQIRIGQISLVLKELKE